MQKPFEGIFGNSCELRVIEFMLPLEGLEYNLSELEGEMGVSRQTLSKVIKKFETWGIVTAKTAGNAAYYSINGKSPLVKSISQLNNVIIETMLGDEELYEIRDYLNARSALHTDVPILIPQQIDKATNEDLNDWPKIVSWNSDPKSPMKQLTEHLLTNEKSALTNMEAS